MGRDLVSTDCLFIVDALIRTIRHLTPNQDIELHCAIGKLIHNVQKLMVIFPFYEKLVSEGPIHM
jgi:hypothetical protein